MGKREYENIATEVKLGSAFIDSVGVHIRLDAEGLPGYKRLRKIGEAILRPVDAHGTIALDHSFLWVTIPMMKEFKTSFSFGNKPRGKR